MRLGGERGRDATMMRSTAIWTCLHCSRGVMGMHIPSPLFPIHADVKASELTDSAMAAAIAVPIAFLVSVVVVTLGVVIVVGCVKGSR